MAIGFVLVLGAGLFSPLWGKAPTRAAAVLLLATLGSASYAFAGVADWMGGTRLAALHTGDQVAASHAWVALQAVSRSAEALVLRWWARR